jgi:hypothetical protein
MDRTADRETWCRHRDITRHQAWGFTSEIRMRIAAHSTPVAVNRSTKLEEPLYIWEPG